MSWSHTELYCPVVRVYNIVTMLFIASHHGLNDGRSGKSESTCWCYYPGSKQCTHLLTKLASLVNIYDNGSFPIIWKMFFTKQIRRQKDSNLIRHSLVTVTVTLRSANIWVACKHSGHCLCFNYFSHGLLNFPRPPAPPRRDPELSTQVCRLFRFWLGVTEKGEVDGLITDRAAWPVRENNW